MAGREDAWSAQAVKLPRQGCVFADLRQKASFSPVVFVRPYYPVSYGVVLIYIAMAHTVDGA